MKRFAMLYGIVAVALIWAPASAGPPSAARLLERARQTLSPVNDYTVDIRLDVKSETIAIKAMTMTLYFKKPDKTRIVAREGFAAIPRNVTLGNAVEKLTKNCRPVLLRTEKKQGVDCYVVRLDPTRGASQPTTTLWLDKARLLVLATRMDGPFPVKTEWQYAKVDEKYNLPRRIDAEVMSPQGRAFPGHHDGPWHRDKAAGNPTQPEGGTQTIHATISFSNYRVNRGIRDSVFTSDKPPSHGR